MTGSPAGSPLATVVDDLVISLRDRGMPSARNLLATVFGDVVAPHDAAVPVQALAQLLEPLGASERLVRTSLTRLVRDGILRNERIGRRSVYSIDPQARPLFQQADERIYNGRQLEWDGRWTLAVIDGTSSTAHERTVLRRELGWLGLGPIAPNVLASPNVSPQTVTAALERIGGDHHVLVTRGAAADGTSTMSSEEIARRSTPVQDLSDRYTEFIDRFGPCSTALDRTREPSPQDCCSLRLLSIAVFRRVALADPGLPGRLLPDDWSGQVARELVASLYHRAREPADAWIADVFSGHRVVWPATVDLGDRFR